MPSRRRVLAGIGTVAGGTFAGCPSDAATTGTVTRKDVTVAVPRQTGEPVDASVALFGYEPDRRLVHGEYDPDYAGDAVDEATLSAPEAVHETLSNEFSAVSYAVNLVPDEGAPVNGVVSREDFDALTVGATATVEPYRGTDGLGRARVRDAEPRERDPMTVTISEFDLGERVGDD